MRGTMNRPDFKTKLDRFEEVGLLAEGQLRGVREFAIDPKDPWPPFSSVNHKDFAATLRLICEAAGKL